MKKILFLSIAILITTALLAQKGKTSKEEARKIILGGEKKSSNEEARKVILGGETNNKTDGPIWDGTSNPNGGGKPSKNQPAKVRAAFSRDYPNAVNVRWSKYRGDWTATFNQGLSVSTAVYHANGQRKDTRTVVGRPQLPKVILNDIFKKHPRTELSDIVKIEAPLASKNIFRIKTIEAGTSRFVFYDAGGKEVKYDY